jgi:hypothetical protein
MNSVLKCAVLTVLHLITPWALLLLTLALSIGDALEAPTWRAVLPELVSQQGLMPAIALNGISAYVAKALSVDAPTRMQYSAKGRTRNRGTLRHFLFSICVATFTGGALRT